jgi:hypothetical protein
VLRDDSDNNNQTIYKYNSGISKNYNNEINCLDVISLYIMLITFQPLCTLTQKRSHGKLTLLERTGLETLASNAQGPGIEGSIPGVTKFPLARERTWSF